MGTITMLNQQHAIAHIESYIQPLLLNVLKSSKLPLCKCCESIEIHHVSSSCGQSEGDCFKLTIPYARYNVTWTVLFDSQCPEMGPDFIFHDNNFLGDVDVDTIGTKIPSLANWDCNDENALLNVLMELLICYKQYQIQLLQKEDQLQSDYAALIKSKIVQPEDIELLFLPSSSKPTEARFLITLPITMFEIQHPIEKPKNNIKILLTYTGAKWTKTAVQLCLPDSLENTLGGKGSLHQPRFSFNETMFSYVSCIRSFIQEKINSIIQGFHERKEFIEIGVEEYYKYILEYDWEDYTYITCLIEVRQFPIVLHVRLSLRFPEEQPTISLQSPYIMQSKYETWTFTLPTFNNVFGKNANELWKGIMRDVSKHVDACYIVRF